MPETVVIAVLPPADGKAARLEELLVNFCKDVQDKEPNCLRFHLHKQTDGGDTPTFCITETYKDQASYAAHNETNHFQSLIKSLTDEGLLGDAKIVPCQSIAGFESR